MEREGKEKKGRKSTDSEIVFLPLSFLSLTADALASEPVREKHVAVSDACAARAANVGAASGGRFPMPGTSDDEE